MRLKRAHLLTTVLSALALLVPLGASASQGTVAADNTQPAPASPGRTSPKSGATFVAGAGLDGSGNAPEGKAQEGQPTLGASGATRVSEPVGTYALLLAGLAAIGFTVRRRMP